MLCSAKNFNFLFVAIYFVTVLCFKCKCGMIVLIIIEAIIPLSCICAYVPMQCKCFYKNNILYAVLNAKLKHMDPSVQCSDTAMTLKVKGVRTPHFLVDSGRFY